jgi:hypothetical protein
VQLQEGLGRFPDVGCDDGIQEGGKIGKSGATKDQPDRASREGVREGRRAGKSHLMEEKLGPRVLGPSEDLPGRLGPHGCEDQVQIRQPNPASVHRESSDLKARVKSGLKRRLLRRSVRSRDKSVHNGLHATEVQWRGG